MIRVITIEQGDRLSTDWDEKVNAWLEKFGKTVVEARIGMKENGQKSFVALYEEVTESPGPTVRKPRPIETPQGEEGGPETE